MDFTQHPVAPRSINSVAEVEVRAEADGEVIRAAMKRDKMEKKY